MKLRRNKFADIGFVEIAGSMKWEGYYYIPIAKTTCYWKLDTPIGYYKKESINAFII